MEVVFLGRIYGRGAQELSEIGAVEPIVSWS
jgi:hypothetical protein